MESVIRAQATLWGHHAASGGSQCRGDLRGLGIGKVGKGKPRLRGGAGANYMGKLLMNDDFFGLDVGPEHVFNRNHIVVDGHEEGARGIVQFLGEGFHAFRKPFLLVVPERPGKDILDLDAGFEDLGAQTHDFLHGFHAFVGKRGFGLRNGLCLAAIDLSRTCP